MLAAAASRLGPARFARAMAEPAIPQGAEPESAIHGPIADRYDLRRPARPAAGWASSTAARDRRPRPRRWRSRCCASRSPDRPDAAPPVRRRGPDHRPAPAPRHPARPRRRHAARRPAVPGHEAHQGPHPRRAARATGPTRPHDRRRFVAVFEQVCQAVAYAHAPRRHPPRPEAGQRHGRGVRRGPGHGLGAGQGPRPARAAPPTTSGREPDRRRRPPRRATARSSRPRERRADDPTTQAGRLLGHARRTCRRSRPAARSTGSTGGPTCSASARSCARS